MSRFYFAWVDPSETSFGSQHLRSDEFIFTFSIDHAEGDPATLSIDIKNPKVGLLAPGRKIWAWFAFEDNHGEVFPLFFGRLVGIPTNVLAEVCTLSFVAKPLNTYTQKQAIAETLKVAPFYDPIFIDATLVDDPDTILEGYSRLWHYDRVTGVITTSDIIVGEAGEIEFSSDDIPYDSVAVTPGETPLTQILINATVNWQQVSSGTIPVYSGVFESESLEELLSSWPKVGTDLGGGYTVAAGTSATDFWGINGTQVVSSSSSYTNKQETHLEGDVMSSNSSASSPQYADGVKFREVTTSEVTQTGFIDSDGDPPLNIPATINRSFNSIPTYNVPVTLNLTYNASRARTERVSFTLVADLQQMLSLPEELDHEAWAPGLHVSIGNLVIYNQALYECTGIGFYDPTLLHNGEAVSGIIDGVTGFPGPNQRSGHQLDGGGVEWTFVQTSSFSDQESLDVPGRNVDSMMPDGTFPIGDPARRSYFPTDRGRQSIEYLISLARAHLLYRSRAVQVSFDIRFEAGMSLSLQNNGRLFDPRLPGGTASGKIVAYSLKGDGDAGSLIANCTLGCAVGYGRSVEPIPGEPEWFEAGYIDDAYQQFDGASTVIGDVGYTMPIDAAVDDGLWFPMTNVSQVLVSQNITGATYTLTLKPVVNGPFGADYFLNLTKLQVPQQIDLEAPVNDHT